MRLRRILFVFLFSLIGAGLLLAQYSAGRIQGTVRDATGAVVPNAKISAEMIATGTKFSAESDRAGLYVFPTLQPGKYQLTVEAPGMEKWQGELELLATQEATLDPTLKVGSAATQVTVAGNAGSLVVDSTPTLSNIVERERIEQLPELGRDITTIVQLTVPGVENGCCSSDRPSVDGQRAGNLQFTQDGASLLDDNTERISFSPPGLDTVQEVSVETSVSSARYASPLSADYSTRSGTNQWHGGAFYEGRNNGFGVARSRQQYTPYTQLIQNQFGASLGGPVRLPHIYNGKNRTFFFVAWEGVRLRQGVTVTGSVPTMAMRQGDFSGMTSSAGQPEILYDPLSTGPAPDFTRTPFPNNQIPISRESPFAKYVWSVVPQPTLPNANPALTYNYSLPSPNNTTQNTPTVRIDHQFSEKDSIFGRLTYSTYLMLEKYNSGTQVPSLDDLWNYQNDTNVAYNPTISWFHSFSPTFFMETLGIVSSDKFGFCATCPADTADNISRFGLPNPLGVMGAPSLSNAGYFSYIAEGFRAENTKRKVFEQNYTKVVGKHQLRFGWHFNDEVIAVTTDHPDALDINFGSSATSLYNPATGNTFGAVTNTGDNNANFFLGYAGVYSQVMPPGNAQMASKQAAGYIQDDWKIRPDLTLNLGFRWDYFPMFLDQGGLDSAFDFANGAIVRNASVNQLVSNQQTNPAVVNAYNAVGVKFETPKQAGWGSLVNVGEDNPDPRVGLAYSPHVFGHRVVLRGGFGIFREDLPPRDYQGARIEAPLEDSSYYNVNSASTTPDGLPNLYIRSNPTVVAGFNSANVIVPGTVSPVSPGVTVTALNRNMPTTLVREWNATMETQLMKNTMLRVSYKGNQGRNEDQFVDYNGQPSGYVWYVTTGLPAPTGTYANTTGRDYNQTTYGNIQLWSKVGYSNFEGMNVQVERRFVNGLAFQGWYALSNALNTIGDPSETTTTTLPDPDTFIPGTVPTSLSQELRFLDYQRDSSIPHHRITANLVYQLPVGKGKRFLSNARGVLDGVLGGWQMSAYATIQSRYWALPTTYNGLGKVQIYGFKYPIEDCRSTAATATVASCLPGYLYYNGYIPANQINSYNSKGVPDGVMGVPANYVPSEQPLNPIPASGCPAGNALCGTDDVYVPLNNGTQVLTAFNNGLNGFRNQYIPGPWTTPAVNASLFKEFPIHERFKFRIQMDAFNVLNMPGMNNVTAATGIINQSVSSNSPRVLQWTARLKW